MWESGAASADRLACLAGLARLAARPGPGYARRLARCQSAYRLRPEALRHLEEFASRVAGLSVDELQELYDITITSLPPATDRDSREAGPVTLIGVSPRAIDQAIRTPEEGAHLPAEALAAIEHVLPPLAAARNPFAWLLRAISVTALDVPDVPDAPDAPVAETTRPRGGP
jgi:hypothetical protein